MATPETKHFHRLVQTFPSMTGKVVLITGCTSGTGFVPGPGDPVPARARAPLRERSGANQWCVGAPPVIRGRLVAPGATGSAIMGQPTLRCANLGAADDRDPRHVPRLHR